MEKQRKLRKRESDLAAAQEIGKIFDSWTVLAVDETPRASRQRYYLCRCVCGRERSVRRSALLHGYTTSCGCMSVSKHRARQSDDCDAIQGSSPATLA